MSRSFLIQLAYDSINEVLQAKNIIDTKAILKEYPLLNESIPMTIKLFSDGEICGYYEDLATKTVLENIFLGAKIAAFEDKKSSPLTLSKYAALEIEIALQTPEGVISHKA
jgi:AMMECR1 domain-containing protein